MADLDPSIAASSVNIVDEMTGDAADVTAASAAATIAEKALVVGLSPNSPVSGAVTTTAPIYITGTTRALSLDPAGNLRVSTNSAGANSPGTVGAGESINNRAYQTTFEITLGNGGTEVNAILMRNPSASGKKAYISYISFSNTTGAAKSSILRVYSNPTLTTAAVTFQGAADTVTRVAHGFTLNQLVYFTTIVTTTGIVINTDYYVIAPTANTFQLSLTPSGAAINLVTDGTGTAPLFGPHLLATSMNVGGGAAQPLVETSTVPTTTSLGTKLSVAAQTNEQAAILYDWGLIISAGNSILLTGSGSANNVPLVINIIWSEAA